MRVPDFQPIPFDPVHDAAVLNALGYIREHFPACWEDVGTCESGPRLEGGPAYTMWSHRDGHSLIVMQGEIVDSFTQPPLPPGWFDDTDELEG